MTDPIPELQLTAAVAAVTETLGPTVVGAYLHGSAVAGGLRHRSDLDILVVTARPTTRPEKQAIVTRLFEVSDRADTPGFERPIELTIVVGPDVKPWRYPPSIDFQYGEWLRAELERGELDPSSPTAPDLATILTIVRGQGQAIVGPPPWELLDPVPQRDLRRAMLDELPSLLVELDTDTRNIVLTLARVLVTVRTGEIRSKDGAAAWVLQRVPGEHRPVLERARAVYLDEEPERWDDLRHLLHPFADHIVEAIRAGAAEPA